MKNNVPDGRNKCRGVFCWRSGVYEARWEVRQPMCRSHVRRYNFRWWQSRRREATHDPQGTPHAPPCTRPKSLLPPPAFSRTPQHTLRTLSSRTQNPLRTSTPQTSSSPYSDPPSFSSDSFRIFLSLEQILERGSAGEGEWLTGRGFWCGGEFGGTTTWGIL